jgi:hypothetical protein
MRKKHSYITTKEILDDFASAQGVPRELVEKMYYHYVSALNKEVRHTDSTAYKLGSFALLNVVAADVVKELNRLKGKINSNSHTSDLISGYTGKIERLAKLQKEYIKNGLKHYSMPYSIKKKKSLKIKNG